MSTPEQKVKELREERQRLRTLETELTEAIADGKKQLKGVTKRIAEINQILGEDAASPTDGMFE